MKTLVLLGGLALLTAAGSAQARATATKILDNGPDAEKKVLVIIGDGYTADTMEEYHQYVQDTVLDGLFARDAYFRAHHTAFNVYRIDLESAEAGVTTRRYESEGCGTRTKTDDVSTLCDSSSSPACYEHDTAFDYVFTNCWGRCWMEGSSTTEASIKKLLDVLVPKRDMEVRVLSVLSGEVGGCGGGNKLAVTSGAAWTVLAHEMGHMVSNLYDEYVAKAYTTTPFPSGPVNTKNCSTIPSRPELVWADRLEPGIALPTTWDSSSMDADETVGAFEGCATYGRSIYRPVGNCRMRGNVNQFCPVCQDTLNQTLAGFPDTTADYAFVANYPGAACAATGAAATVYTSQANISNPSAAPAAVLCPARRVQDNGAFTNHLMGQAFVVDQHPTQNVCCQLFARSPGGSVATGAHVCSTGSSASMQQLKLDYPKVSTNASFAHFALSCSLPAAANGQASSVLSYRIGQQSY